MLLTYLPTPADAVEAAAAQGLRVVGDRSGGRAQFLKSLLTTTRCKGDHSRMNPRMEPFTDHRQGCAASRTADVRDRDAPDV